ncbi:transglutaminase domain-containing protein [Sulfurospirillum arcachonense]|uniref:transglutaminase domain-containing protein n=1 Tax=Sulfurospirillum arcachonense TaxID=57666 RepID=UPI0004683D33|nr:transglutaminase domain-containing protein [Sulfurospirillum arcachonense]
MKNLTLFIALFFCEAIPTFIVTQYIYPDYIISSLVISLLAISLIFSWFFADYNNKLLKYIGYIGMFIGIASSITYFTNYASSTGILIVALSMIIGLNIFLNERRMLAYLLIFSFMLFLFASSIVFNQYSILSIILFTFSFFTVVVADYYNSRIYLQSHYNYKKRHSFFGTILILVVVVSIFTVVLYYFLPQPQSIHYGVLPFGGTKQYKGVIGEDNEKSKYYKEHTTELPKYTIDGKETKSATNHLVFNKPIKKVNQEKKIYSGKEKNFLKEKKLKSKNKKAYYSNIYTDENNDLSKILFEVKGKEARFLRGNTYAAFNGKSWKKILTKMYTIKNGNKGYYRYWNGKEWTRRTNSIMPNDLYYNEYFTQKTDNYTITVKGKLVGKPIIYIPVGLLRLQFPTDTFYEDAARTIYAPSQLEIGTYYTASVESEGYYGYDAMSYADVWYKKVYSRAGYKLDPKVNKLAKKLTNGWNNSFEKAQVIVKYFKINYKYKHSSIKSTIHNQTLSKMLFETKIGNALQFNTALIMMLRSTGEYARLATGYAPNEYNLSTSSYIIERKNKAVWTEIFVKDRGWVAIHAADDIPFEGEAINGLNETLLTNAQLIYLSVFSICLILTILYYSRKYAWSYLSKFRMKKYMQKSDIHFVIDTYKEVEKYYRHFQKGQKPSYTLQEYESYIKELKPQNSPIIEYLIFYSNQAIYRGELDLGFDKDRYFEVALYLIDNSFEIKIVDSYVVRKLLRIWS